VTEVLTLRHGDLQFTALVAGTGPTVLLLHGFPDGPETFVDQMGALAQAGYRAVAVTMRGYEPSSQPADGDYHVIRLAEDVVAFIEALGVEKVHIVGHDWGASVAFAAAGLAPDRIASLTAIAVPHPSRFAALVAADAAQMVRSGYIMEFQSPDAEAMIAADDFAYLERLWRKWSPSWTIPGAVLRDMKQRFGQPGVPTATLSWYRQAFDAVSLAGQAGAALYAKPVEVPTLGLCGSEDGCIGAEVFRAAMWSEDFAAGLACHTLIGAGHFVHREAPGEVNRLILEWLATYG
jgi:pimeloyl-ACP methyl ester carboxylesterase